MTMTDKRALVTGAASGIGRAIAARFVREGAAVALVDIDSSALDAAVQELRARGGNVVGFVADVGIAAQAEGAAAAALQEFGSLDILVNNAGINAAGTIDQVDLDYWNRVLAVNLTGFFVMSKALWTPFARQGHGVILNMSSIMGLTGARDSFVYCTCKAAIIAFTKSLAADGGPIGIRVNCVCPGYVQTPINDRAHSRQTLERIATQIPMRRMASADEIAGGFAYLASSDASYANGSVMVLDGAATVGFAGCYLEG